MTEFDEKRIAQQMGRNLKFMRCFRGLSQASLAKSVGISFQQLQKYENGSNRISGPRLYLLSRALKMPYDVFFEGIDH